MRLSITPIGATGRSPAAVANAVVAYLDTAGTDLGAGLLSESAVGYYADSVEGPGLWLGGGAASLGLTGVVNPEHLRVVLEDVTLARGNG